MNSMSIESTPEHTDCKSVSCRHAVWTGHVPGTIAAAAHNENRRHKITAAMWCVPFFGIVCLISYKRTHKHTKEKSDTQEAWWLPTSRANGDAFALSDEEG